ncbi:Uncharacterized protein TCM_013907 [Theobroma cacao]|uniref:Uncharacterized protein n=1 Tax=Theobroma cacao TaxID=3641 RepID=A0A061FX02_THECC|nr:Uncharacterized protein TCM_013907 [Theobroma cacao]
MRKSRVLGLLSPFKVIQQIGCNFGPIDPIKRLLKPNLHLSSIPSYSKSLFRWHLDPNAPSQLPTRIKLPPPRRLPPLNPYYHRLHAPMIVPSSRTSPILLYSANSTRITLRATSSWVSDALSATPSTGPSVGPSCPPMSTAIDNEQAYSRLLSFMESIDARIIHRLDVLETQN